jgi:uncharacterized protein (UPF0333 family)
MKFFQKIALSACIALQIFTPLISFAQSESTEQSKSLTPISVFVREECIHCQAEKKFLTELQKSRSDIEIFYYDLAFSEGYDLWVKFTDLEKIPKVTPITLVGNSIISGFDTAETTGAQIISLLDKSQNIKTLNAEEFIKLGGSKGSIEKISASSCDENGLIPCEEPKESFLVRIPLIGNIDIKKYSLPVLSAILGFADGFNPCAMWVLITFLVILIDAGSKKKMWQLAGIFIAAETIMYYLILNVWFTTFDFIGLNSIITPIVGLVATGAGAFFLYEGFKSDGTCKITDLETKSKTRQKIKDLVKKDITWYSIIGILGLAFSVNIIEFACSIGIPQTFTKILEIQNFSFWENQFYMAIYILMYMVDDFIVFGIAIYSFEKIGITTKYTKISHFIGGTLMLILGLILLLKPELLTMIF